MSELDLLDVARKYDIFISIFDFIVLPIGAVFLNKFAKSIRFNYISREEFDIHVDKNERSLKEYLKEKIDGQREWICEKIDSQKTELTFIKKSIESLDSKLNGLIMGMLEKK